MIKTSHIRCFLNAKADTHTNTHTNTQTHTQTHKHTHTHTLIEIQLKSVNPNSKAEVRETHTQTKNKLHGGKKQSRVRVRQQRIHEDRPTTQDAKATNQFFDRSSDTVHIFHTARFTLRVRYASWFAYIHTQSEIYTHPDTQSKEGEEKRTG